MFSKKTRNIIALSLSISVFGGGMDLCVNNNVIAHAEEKDIQDQGKDASNFNYAKEELTKQLDQYNISKDTTEADIKSELGKFSYTTESAVNIKAKTVENFENNGNGCSFDCFLYEENNINSTNSFTYSKKYNKSNEVQLNLSTNMALATTASSVSLDVWQTDQGLDAAKSIIINGVKFESVVPGKLFVYGYTNDVSPNLELPSKIICADGSFNVTDIESLAFFNCDKIFSIKIPKSIEYIDVAVFYNTENLNNIEVDVDNYYYASKDGVLFDKRISELISYPEGKNGEEYIFPQSVKKIDAYAFFGCQGLKKIEVPDSVVSIGYCAFNSCYNLKSVWFPENASIEDSSLLYGLSLTVFMYKTLADNTIKVTDIYKDQSSHDKVVGYSPIIPDFIFGKKVTEIENGIFDGLGNRMVYIYCYNTQIKEQLQRSDELKDKVVLLINDKLVNADTTVPCDGRPHSIIVTGAPVGTDIKYSKTENEGYTSYNPEYTNIGKYITYYIVSGKDYGNLAAGYGELNITGNFVGNITISSEGGASEINTKGGSLKLKGIVSPSDASIQTLKWRILDGQDIGSISEDGTLTANGMKNGVMLIQAEATDGSNKLSNILSINITNQVILSNGDSHHSGKTVSIKENDTSVELNGKNQEEIDAAFHNEKIKIITIDLSIFDNGNQQVDGNNSNMQGADGRKASDSPALTKEILNNLKIYKEKNLIIKNAVQDNNAVITKMGDIEVKYTEDGHFKFTQNNIPLTGFKKIGNAEYYFDSNGNMQTGWIKDNNSWYYFDSETGVMMKGWLKDKNIWYHLNEQGKMDVGWFKDSDGNWYYLNWSGAMVTNTIIDGYAIGGNGAWIK